MNENYRVSTVTVGAGVRGPTIVPVAPIVVQEQSYDVNLYKSQIVEEMSSFSVI